MTQILHQQCFYGHNDSCQVSFQSVDVNLDFWHPGPLSPFGPGERLKRPGLMGLKMAASGSCYDLKSALMLASPAFVRVKAPHTFSNNALIESIHELRIPIMLSLTEKHCACVRINIAYIAIFFLQLQCYVVEIQTIKRNAQSLTRLEISLNSVKSALQSRENFTSVTIALMIN